MCIFPWIIEIIYKHLRVSLKMLVSVIIKSYYDSYRAPCTKPDLVFMFWIQLLNILSFISYKKFWILHGFIRLEIFQRSRCEKMRKPSTSHDNYGKLNGVGPLFQDLNNYCVSLSMRIQWLKFSYTRCD